MFPWSLKNNSRKRDDTFTKSFSDKKEKNTMKVSDQKEFNKKVQIKKNKYVSK